MDAKKSLADVELLMLRRLEETHKNGNDDLLKKIHTALEVVRLLEEELFVEDIV